MGISAIANLGFSLVQSVLSGKTHHSQQTASATNQAKDADNAQLHPVASLFARLDALETANPQGFQSFVTQAAAEVTAAASNQPAGGTKDFLNDLATALQNGAQNPGQPLQFPTTGGHYNIHFHPVANSLVRSLDMQAGELLLGSGTPN